MSQATLDTFLRSLDAQDGAGRAARGAEPVSPDGYDTSLFRTFNGLERSRAEDALIARGGAGDGRALVTLGRLKVVRALDAARAQTDAADPWLRLCAHRALARLGGEAEAGGLIALAAAGDAAARRAALEDLAAVEGEGALRALYHALDDVDADVRRQAFRAALARYGEDELARAAAGGAEPLAPAAVTAALLGAALEPLWRLGAWEARNTIAGLSLGRRVDALALRYRPSAPPGFRAAVEAELAALSERSFDAALVAGERGHDRRWAEVALALALAPGPAGARAAIALGALGARWALAAIEAAAWGLAPDDPLVAAAWAVFEALPR